ncbi:hypothetical protein COCCU_13620 [Corynebacterium occultum]|uniref:PepSY domain-containing protein n=1 Tax=Corynebacterium occultum TaxID=2675219 RepID=A0A6B8W4X1_9CORY|nr:hypothetical protein [Corynebacterium occultum]QGU08614.1 hypothetical protein COCCU_13620 [Corynebacterium occultum]
MNRSGIRGTIIALSGVAALFLTGCAGSEGPNPGTSTVAISTPVETVEEQPTQAPAESVAENTPPREDDGGEEAARGNSAPCEVSGYSGEGDRERREEGFSEQQVSDAVAQGCATAEWEDDDYWEIDLDWIEVDIRPDGTVIEVDD